MNEVTYIIPGNGKTSTIVAKVDQVGLTMAGFRSALVKALNAWYEHTPEGKEAWKKSNHRFCLEDLAVYQNSPVLKGYLMSQSIADLRVSMEETNSSVNEETADEDLFDEAPWSIITSLITDAII